MNNSKRCIRCNEHFPATADYFHRDKNRPDGFYPYCKPCRKIEAAKHYVDNRERILEVNLAWRLNNTDKVKNRQRERNKENAVHVKEYKRRWRKQNVQKLTAESRRWREQNRERYREWRYAYEAENRERRLENARRLREANRARYNAYQAKRRALKANGEGNVTGEDVLLRLALQNYHCQWCSIQLGTDYHVDHCIPLSKGGQHASENIAIACQTCNLRKSDKLPYTEWIPPNPLTGS